MTVRKATRYLIAIEGDRSRNYAAYSPDVPGGVAAGETPEECKREMREALAVHLEGLALAGAPIPRPRSSAACVDVAAPAV